MNTFANALKTLHTLVEPVTKDWMLIGTSSLFLQGFHVIPKDIDILCTASVVSLIEEALLTYKVALKEDISRDKFRSIFSRYHINGLVVELMGELEVNTPDGWIKLNDVLEQSAKVVFNGLDFCVPKKTDQIKIYTFFGREKDQFTIQMLNQLNSQ